MWESRHAKVTGLFIHEDGLAPSMTPLWVLIGACVGALGGLFVAALVMALYQGG